MFGAAVWLAEKAKTLSLVAWRFAAAPGDAAPEEGQLSREEAMAALLAEDKRADANMARGADASGRIRVGVSVGAMLLRAGILADLISLRRDVVRNLLDASLAGDRAGMYKHLNQLWDCLGLPAIEGPEATNVVPIWPRNWDKKTEA